MPNQNNIIFREEERFLTRLAWACEIEGLTQAEAAEQFGVTRLRVNKALAEARKRGIVRVYINSEYALCAETEYALKEKYNLSDVHVAPISVEHGDIKELIGSCLGEYLSKLLASPTINRFGISWGSTLKSAMQHMRPLNRPELEIVSAMGCVTRSSDLNIIESARILANLCNAQKSYFTAPLYANTPRSRNILVKQEVFDEMIQRIKTIDSLAMTVGDVTDLSNMVRDGLPYSVTMEELVELGAVGDALGYYLDKNGKPIKHSINGCVVGIELKDLKNIPNVILAAGGEHKTAIIKAVLKLNWVDTFITDQNTANLLLADTQLEKQSA